GGRVRPSAARRSCGSGTAQAFGRLRYATSCSGLGPGITATSSQPSSPQLSSICLVAWTSSGTVAYSHFCMASTLTGGRRRWALTSLSRGGRLGRAGVPPTPSGAINMTYPPPEPGSPQDRPPSDPFASPPGESDPFQSPG